MKWFNKSSCENIASHHNKIVQQRHKRIKKTTKITIIKCSEKSKKYFNFDKHMTTSLSGIDFNKIEKLDPEDFFEDPIHVKNYREEEKFLNLMSEWEIIDNSAEINGNYFSADFEEELLHLRTQSSNNDNDNLTTTTTTTAITTEINSLCKTPLSISSSSSLCSASYLTLLENESLYPTDESKLSELCLVELLFADKIQLGIIMPKSLMYLKYVDDDDDEETFKLQNSRRQLRKRKFLHDKKNNDNHTQEFDLTKHTNCSGSGSSNNNNNDDNINFAQSKRALKYCGINRSKFKTEALAGSIMGAIGKCPTQDKDCLYSGEILNDYNCDHYDIKKHFHLDDEGNILLNINHIVEFKGFGFAVAQNKKHYRRYLRNTQMAFDIDCCHRDCLFVMKRSLTLLWNIIFGHPRNKVNTYSGGPGDTVRSYTLELALDHTSTFSRNIENFISCTKESREATPQVIMRNMRQFMNGMKNYLVKHGEGKFHQEVETARSRLKSDEFLNIDAILETVMHQLVVLPLREHLYGMFVDYYTRSEDIQLLAQNVKYACGRCAADFGIRQSVAPPSCTSLNAISNLLLRLQEAELPLEKLELFLCVISTIFDATGCPRGQQLGADDFLPILVYVVAKCGFVGAEIEAEFMWGLLQPQLLNGEPGYYLTALCSAVHVLKSFMASENESGSGSLDWRSSSLPACSSVLRVIIPDECNGSLQTRTLPVRPHTTTREVCRIIAHKARITNPQDYALFKLVDGEETLLSDIECPQDIRLVAKGKHCMLAYKRIDAKIAWPTATQPNFN